MFTSQSRVEALLQEHSMTTKFKTAFLSAKEDTALMQNNITAK